MKQPVWKVFVPHDLFIQSDCFLYGRVNEINQSVYITASTNKPSLTSKPDEVLSIIGRWSSFTESKTRILPKKHRSIRNTSTWTHISTNQNAEVTCNVTVNITQCKCTCVIYNPSELLKSAILCERSETSSESCDNITAVVTALKMSQRHVTPGLKMYCCQTNNATAIVRLVQWLLLLLTYIYKPFQYIGLHKNREYGPSLKQKILSVPIALSQLGTRAQDLQNVSFHTSPVVKLRSVDKCVRQILDTCLGVCLMYYLMSGNRAEYIANVSLAYGDIVAVELKKLLHWLMGSPAGLKLNSQLTHFLANFFQYHIYLWQGYLQLLRDMLGPLLYYGSMTGVWGLSVQLALFQDIFSTLTIHIYCFYVYAARLYHLQLCALASLWRLFRGKKWNVLRQRVDSAVYDADQLFVGTLAFTILLFLLPTIGLYYVVFSMLRLLVLTVQGVVCQLRELLNTVPVWSIWLWIIKSKSLTRGAVFQEHGSNNNQSSYTLLLSMQGTQIGLSEVLSLTSERVSSKTSYPWVTLVSNLLHGDLVYPWIEKKHN